MTFLFGVCVYVKEGMEFDFFYTRNRFTTFVIIFYANDDTFERISRYNR